jgi:hypothetical protein
VRKTQVQESGQPLGNWHLADICCPPRPAEGWTPPAQGGSGPPECGEFRGGRADPGRARLGHGRAPFVTRGAKKHKSRRVVNPLGMAPRGHKSPAQAGRGLDPARPGWVRTPHTWGHQGGVGGAWAGTSDPWAGTLCDPGCKKTQVQESGQPLGNWHFSRTYVARPGRQRVGPRPPRVGQDPPSVWSPWGGGRTLGGHPWGLGGRTRGAKGGNICKFTAGAATWCLASEALAFQSVRTGDSFIQAQVQNCGQPPWGWHLADICCPPRPAKAWTPPAQGGSGPPECGESRGGRADPGRARLTPGRAPFVTRGDKNTSPEKWSTPWGRHLADISCPPRPGGGGIPPAQGGSGPPTLGDIRGGWAEPGRARLTPGRAPFVTRGEKNTSPEKWSTPWEWHLADISRPPRLGEGWTPPARGGSGPPKGGESRGAGRTLGGHV